MQGFQSGNDTNTSRDTPPPPQKNKNKNKICAAATLLVSLLQTAHGEYSDKTSGFVENVLHV